MITQNTDITGRDPFIAQTAALKASLRKKA